MSEHQLTPAQNGATVSAAVGDAVVLCMPERPTTGYRWQFEVPAGLTILNDDFSVAGSAPGAGGQRCLHLDAAKAGRYALAATLRRVSETRTAPVARFAVTVEVA